MGRMGLHRGAGISAWIAETATVPGRLCQPFANLAYDRGQYLEAPCR